MGRSAFIFLYPAKMENASLLWENNYADNWCGTMPQPRSFRIIPEQAPPISFPIHMTANGSLMWNFPREIWYGAALTAPTAGSLPFRRCALSHHGGLRTTRKFFSRHRHIWVPPTKFI